MQGELHKIWKSKLGRPAQSVNPNDEKEMNKLSVKKLKNMINFDFNEE